MVISAHQNDSGMLVNLVCFSSCSTKYPMLEKNMAKTTWWKSFVSSYIASKSCLNQKIILKVRQILSKEKQIKKDDVAL